MLNSFLFKVTDLLYMVIYSLSLWKDLNKILSVSNLAIGQHTLPSLSKCYNRKYLTTVLNEFSNHLLWLPCICGGEFKVNFTYYSHSESFYKSLNFAFCFARLFLVYFLTDMLFFSCGSILETPRSVNLKCTVQ